jgi:CBS domain-containing protein
MDVLNMLINRSIVTIDGAATLQQAARLMRDKRIGSVLVEKNGKITGIVSDTDVTRRAVAENIAPDRVTVESLMSSPLISIDIHSTPEMANDLMKDSGIRHLPVTENDKIIGIISVRDLLHYFKVYYGGIGSLKKEKK